MTERHDNVADLVARAEAHAQQRKTAKVRQMWTGDIAVRLEMGGKTPPSSGEYFAKILEEKSPKSWHHIAGVTYGANWISSRATYIAKGANADDAEKLVTRLAEKADVTILEVAVSTQGIMVLGNQG